MKTNKFYLFLVVLSVFFISIFYFEFFNNSLKILEFISNISSSKYIFLYLVFILFYFITPLPVTVAVILNGYLFDYLGFVYSIIFTLIGSSVLFFLSIKIKDTFKIDFNKYFQKKKINLLKISEHKYAIFFSRFILPYFIHNIYYGFQSVSFRKFILYVFLAETPMIIALNSIGSSLKYFQINYSLTLIDLISERNFYIPFLIIILIIFVLNYIKSSLINKK